jgi:hypothetical protein
MLWLVLVACSGKHTDPSHPSGSGAPPDGGVAAGGPSEAECVAQIKHAVELELAARKATGAELPTADETTKLEAELRDRFLGVCRAGTLDGHRCAMAATTLAELANCHATPSSSTSNKSVAPGGITPAAPRSP